MNTVWIARDAMAAMEKEANRAFPLESGGILAGYRSDATHVVLRNIGPGTVALHLPHRFEADHQWQCEQLDRLFDESRGLIVYLGEWHTHPNESSEMSALDRRTLSRIARHAQAAAPSALMMIAGGGRANIWSWKAHAYLGRHALGLWPKFGVCELKQFEQQQPIKVAAN